MPLIADLATKFDMDLNAAANMVAKSIGSSTNALARYGITIEGAAGSSERFNSAVVGLSGQVKGLAEAAAKAGTGPLTQLKNLFGDLYLEITGKKLTEHINKLAESIKTLLEINSGTYKANYATEIEATGREMAKNAKNTDDARAAIIAYIEERKKLRAEMNEDIIKAKKFNIRIGPFEQKERVNFAKSSYEANEIAIKNLLATLRDESKMLEIIGQSTIKVDEVTEKSTKTITRKANEMTKLLSSYERLIAKEKEITNIQDIFKTITPTLPDAENRPLAPSNGVIVGTDTTNFKQTTDEINEMTAALQKADSWTMILNNSLMDIGSQLSQGAEDWASYGKSVINALRQAIAGIIAEGIASAVAGSIKASSALGPFAVGIGALAGGAASGLFSTIVPRLAGGGLAYSPQLAVVGDNRNASIDPEVIAPLSKLQAMMGVNVTGSTRIRGRDIDIVWNREQDFKSRT